LEYELALVEAFTNAVRHAHASKTPETPIELEITIDYEAIELKIWDCGSGFNFDQFVRNPLGMEQTAERGRGLKIIRKIADTVSYTHIGQRNCLSIVKHYVNHGIISSELPEPHIPGALEGSKQD
jgi:serine/threonine-protein kinase RsbW